MITVTNTGGLICNSKKNFAQRVQVTGVLETMLLTLENLESLTRDMHCTGIPDFKEEYFRKFEVDKFRRKLRKRAEVLMIKL